MLQMRRKCQLNLIYHIAISIRDTDTDGQRQLSFIRHNPEIFNRSHSKEGKNPRGSTYLTALHEVDPRAPTSYVVPPFAGIKAQKNNKHWHKRRKNKNKNEKNLSRLTIYYYSVILRHCCFTADSVLVSLAAIHDSDLPSVFHALTRRTSSSVQRRRLVPRSLLASLPLE